MKKITKITAIILSLVIVMSSIPLINAAQDGTKVLWSNSFETLKEQEEWSFVDLDEDDLNKNNGWQFKSVDENSAYNAFDGKYSLYSESKTPFNEELKPHNIAISKEIPIDNPDSQSIRISWYAASVSSVKIEEKYSVYVFPGEASDTAIETAIKNNSVDKKYYSEETFKNSTYKYYNHTFDISDILKNDNDYKNSIRIVFYHHTDEPQRALKIDAVSVEAFYDYEYLKNYSFEEGFHEWISISADDDNYGWEHKTINDGSRFAGQDSDGCLVSASYSDSEDKELSPTNYLVSPVIDVPADSRVLLEWYVGAYNTKFYAENYSVYIYIGEDIASLGLEKAKNVSVLDGKAEKLKSETLSKPSKENEFAYRYKVLNDSYSGEKIRIIFVHHDCTGQYYIKLDNVSLSAVEKQEFTATFDANEGAWSDGTTKKTVTAFAGEAIDDPEDDPARDGFKFAGWEGYTGTMPSANVTYKAIWEENTEIQYKLDVYEMDTEGEYPDAPTRTIIFKDGVAGETREITYEAPEVFTVNTDKSVLKGTIADGGKVQSEGEVDIIDGFKVYLERAKYDVVIDGAEPVKVYHGATVTAPTTSTATPPGYTLASWNNGTVALGQEIEVIGALTLTPCFAAGTSTYTIKTYTMGLNGKYGEAAETTGTYTTDETVTYTAPTVEGFKADKDSYSVKVTGDGLAVIEVYYTRNQYDVTIDGVATKVYHGATITAPESTTQTAPEGYAFAGWNNGSIAAGASITVTEALTLEPYFAPNTDTAYTVEIYLMNENGEYPAAASKSVSKTGATDTKATAAHADYAQDAWFAPAAEGNVTEAIITADGKATLKLYYARAQYDVVIDGAEPVKVYHGATINAPKATTQTAPDGCVFAGWNDGTIAAGASITVTEALTLDPYFVEGAATYTVEIYLQDAEGNYPATASETEAKTGKIGDTVTIAHEDYAQEDYYLADDSAANVTKATITADGKAVLKLYYKREIDVVDSLEKATIPDNEVVGSGNETPTEGTAMFYADDENGNGVFIVNNKEEKTVPVTPEAGENTVVYEAPGVPTKVGHSITGWAIDDDLPEALVIKATWTANSYDAVFNANGGQFADGKSEATVSTAYGAEIVAPEAPEKEGYEFKGWVWTNEKGETFEAPTTMPANDVTFTAQWTPNVYNVEFEVDGAKYTTNTVKFDGEYTIPANPKKTGYTFAGWTDANGTQMPATHTIDGTAKFYATWTVNEYTVTWKVEGEADKVETYAYGADITEYAPVKEGYVFSGWNAQVPATMPAEDLTFTGSWTPNEYNVEFYYEVGGAKYTTNTVKFDGEYTIPADPENTGYTFAGWTDADGGEMPATHTIDGTAKFYATWTAIEYTVTFDANDGTFGGSSKPVTKKVKFGDKIILPEKSPTKTGMRFVGWEGYTEGMTMPANNLTFTAKYEEPTKDKDVIKTPSTATISYGDSIILHVDSSKIPAGGKVEWSADNNNFSYKTNGETCTISPEKSGDTTFTATIYDADGNAILKDEQKMTSKAGFFDKIIAFFKGLFGMTKVYPNFFKF